MALNDEQTLLFQDPTGIPIKFFVQKDVPDHAAVCEQIRANGGSVESKIPRAGYVLIIMGSPEGERLRMCWDKPHERPDRFFVPYTFVDACNVAGTLLKQIFRDNGRPIPFHIDSDIANVNVRATLAARIAHSGGDPTATLETARVVLADPGTQQFENLIDKFQNTPDKFVESFQWVKKCVDKGSMFFTPFVYKNPGGRRPGEERMQFSEDDELSLCQWIAEKIPYKESGGRTGNRLYIQLVEKASDPEYEWVNRHTWQSWRERYKKNSARLDLLIATIVEERKPAPGEKGQYGYVRKPEEKNHAARARRRNKRRAAKEAAAAAAAAAANGGTPPNPEPDASQHIPPPPPPPPIHALPMPMAPEQFPPPHGLPPGAIPPMIPPPHMYHQLPPPHMMHPDDLARLGGPMNHPHHPMPHMPGTGPGPLQRTTSNESDPEWAIREGNFTQPDWAKRQHDDDSPDGGAAKRQRVDGEVHVVDQNIQDVAREFRFTIEEVQEYYDKCGAMDRTRSRFKKMRDALDALDDD